MRQDEIGPRPQDIDGIEASRDDDEEDSAAAPPQASTCFFIDPRSLGKDAVRYSRRRLTIAMAA